MFTFLFIYFPVLCVLHKVGLEMLKSKLFGVLNAFSFGLTSGLKHLGVLNKELWDIRYPESYS